MGCSARCMSLRSFDLLAQSLARLGPSLSGLGEQRRHPLADARRVHRIIAEPSQSFPAGAFEFPQHGPLLPRIQPHLLRRADLRRVPHERRIDPGIQVLRARIRPGLRFSHGLEVTPHPAAPQPRIWLRNDSRTPAGSDRVGRAGCNGGGGASCLTRRAFAFASPYRPRPYRRG